MNARIAAGVLGLFAILPMLGAADWPQFNGPNRDGYSQDKGLLKQWPKDGPKLVWTWKDAGTGYSGPAVVGDTLYMMGARKGSEYLYAVDIKKPKELWSVKLGPTFTFKGNSWNEGPSATPTVDGDLIFALSGSGELVCADKTGAVKWQTSMTKNLAGEVNPIGGGNDLGWGYTWSPLVDGDNLICVPGGKKGLVAALNKKTGAVVWRSTEVTDQCTYASPIVAEVQGVRQYIVMTNQGAVGIDPKTGGALWVYKRAPAFTDCVITTPLYHDSQVYMTAAFGLGCSQVKLTKAGAKFKAETVFSERALANQDGGVVRVGDFIYGHSDKKGWASQDWKTGEMNLVNRKMKAGSLIVAEGLLYVYGADNGDVVLVKPDPKKSPWQELGHFVIPEKSANNKPNGKIWTHPIIANGKLYLRDQELLFCYDISAGGAPAPAPKPEEKK
jgi:outer membrane protein assembly factor BamB